MSRESYVTEQDGSPGPHLQPLGCVAGDKAVFAGRVGVEGGVEKAPRFWEDSTGCEFTCLE